MRDRTSIAGVRIASILALASAIMIPWYGWLAALAFAAFLIAGALLAPRTSIPHQGRISRIVRGVQRRLVRHPWRLRRL